MTKLPTRLLACGWALCVLWGAHGLAQAQETATIKRATQLRASPGDAAASVAALAASATVTRTDQRQGAWVQVRAADGAVGWVHMFDIGAPARASSGTAAGVLRGLGPSGGGTGAVTVATATVGIRGLGEGRVAGGTGGGRQGANALPQLAQLATTPDAAKAFATSAALQARKVEALPGTTPAPAEVPGTQGADALATVLQSPASVTLAQEQELGRQMAAQLLQGLPLDPTPEAQRYVSRLGRWLSLQSARPQLPWVFAVIDESDFNAFSTPGGMVFITRGLLDRCEDEAELAGILAHEIAHVVHRHHLQAMHTAARETKVAHTLAALTRYVNAAGYGAEAEMAADREAVVLAARAGLDPYGLVSVLVQLNALGDSDLHYADAHPQSRVRLDQLEQAMGQRLEAYASTKPPVLVEQRLSQTK